MKRIITILIIASSVIACSTNLEEVDAFLARGIDSRMERGTNVRIFYSDSAQVKMIVNAPVLERYNEYINSKDVFPKGIMLEFLDQNRNVSSWLQAETAIREQKTKKITARGNVVFYNPNNEKLETPELIFDENTRIVYTDKLVRITQPEKGDTTYGFGFRSNQEFTVFEIRKKVQGKLNVTDFLAGFK
ncbi:MAG: LPS export ABC transporter periplasmic protein LptC [Saprospiraceae bacterium]|nr:MAG: hypothetical protein UZ09_BCD002000294 [Bacteroidetes bacterium OLB9]MCO6463166.1 LPS export ABC transporter periplasmic protein LptC [Saprospiraceae bacterium]MCZ2339952.1 LPS export ABC transporter periplasmic protein LptC [Chitinophagales bacterium]